MEQLPDELLANVLGRLPPSSLAASRCVRKHWCAVIDARRLLRADLLPLRVEAFFCNSYFIFDRTFFFTHPTAARIPGGHLDFFDDDVDPVAMDHCNGLLLHYEMVVNPATRQWATWPPVPQHMDGLSSSYRRLRFALAYDPMAANHGYEVFLIPLPGTGYLYNHGEGTSSRIIDDDDDADFQQEWPPLAYTVYVFSSTKEWRWEERSFVRAQGGGEAVGTIADMHVESNNNHKAVYSRRSLYVHCPNDSIMRLSLSDDKYLMIKPPSSEGSETKTSRDCGYVSTYIGKSEKGVYYAILDLGGPQFRVWLLSELSVQSQTEWVLKCNVSLQATLNFALHNAHQYCTHGPWIDNFEKETQPTAQEEEEEEEFAEWDFDNGVTVFETETDEKKGSIDFFGFHPYKEIAFLFISNRVTSYHLNTSKVQDLGRITIPQMKNAFPYTPCWIGELYEKNKA